MIRSHRAPLSRFLPASKETPKTRTGTRRAGIQGEKRDPGDKGEQSKQGPPIELGAWVLFTPDQGRTDSSPRRNLIFDRRSAEFDGRVGTVPPNAQGQLVAIALAYRPAARKAFAIAVKGSGLSSGFRLLEIQPGGSVLIRPEQLRLGMRCQSYSFELRQY